MNAKTAPRGAKVEKLCDNPVCTRGPGFTRKSMTPRAADVARGWGKFCCKSCAAEARETGALVQQMQGPGTTAAVTELFAGKFKVKGFLAEGLYLVSRNGQEAMWSKRDLRKTLRCAATGAELELGGEAYGPIGNMDYRSERLAPQFVEAPR